MKIRNRLSYLNKNQSGFTLIELMIAVAISSLVTIGFLVTILQVFHGSLSSSGEMTVVRQVQNAGYYISRDIQMAKEVSIDDNPGTAELEVVTLTWYEYEFYHTPPADPNDRDGNGHQVIYTLVDGKLKRGYYFALEDVYGNVTFDSEPDYTTFVAENISDISCQFYGNELAVTVTASVGGWRPQSATRTYEAEPRPNIY